MRRWVGMKAGTARTSQNRFMLSNLKRICRNHDKQEERACKMEKKSGRERIGARQMQRN